MDLKCVMDRLYEDCAAEMDTASSYRDSGDVELAHFFEGRADGLRQATLLLEIMECTNKKKTAMPASTAATPSKGINYNKIISNWHRLVKLFVRPKEDLHERG